MVFRLFSIGFILCVAFVFAAPVSDSNARISGAPAEDKVCVDRETIVALKEEPASHLKQARESFVKKDMKRAAGEIRKAASFVKLESEAASGKTKQGLAAAEGDLDKLADRVQQGAIKSVKDLDDAIAHVRAALGKLE